MARRLAALKLPDKIRAELDKRLRKAAYGDYIEAAAWLAQKGYKASKSALHRYGQSLMKLDESQGVIKAQLNQARQSINQTRDELLLELGRLRYEAAKIIDKLNALESPIKGP